jgi:hypothetical protein
MLLAFIKMNVRPERRKELLQTFQSIVFQIIKFVTPTGGVTEVGNNNRSILNRGGLK